MSFRWNQTGVLVETALGESEPSGGDFGEHFSMSIYLILIRRGDECGAKIIENLSDTHVNGSL